MNRDELIEELLEELEYDDYCCLAEAVKVIGKFRAPKRVRPNTAVVKNAANSVSNVIDGAARNPGEVNVRDNGISMTVKYSPVVKDETDRYLNKNAFSRIAKMIQTRTRNLHVSVTIKGMFSGNFLTGMIVRVAPSMKYKFKMK